MSEQELPEIEEGDEQRRDALLLKLLRTPPKKRPKRDRSKPKKAASGEVYAATEGKREPSA